MQSGSGKNGYAPDFSTTLQTDRVDVNDLNFDVRDGLPDALDALANSLIGWSMGGVPIGQRRRGGVKRGNARHVVRVPHLKVLLGQRDAVDAHRANAW